MTYTIEQENMVLFIQLEGDLIGGFSSQTLMDTVNEKIAEGVRLCAVDISALRYMNSVGIDVLITLLTKFRNRGGEVVLIKPSPQVKKLLVITKLTAIFNIVEDRTQALMRLDENQ